MTTIAHIITGTVSATVAIVAIAGWQHYHPVSAMGKVDILGIVAAQQQSLTAKMKPGMDAKAQADIIQSASNFGKSLDVALTAIASECKCTIINAAAVIKDAPNAIPDYTANVRALTGAKN